MCASVLFCLTAYVDVILLLLTMLSVKNDDDDDVNVCNCTTLLVRNVFY